ncbi:unnamed protein product [Debaryomyces fabryi]|nr:unnamed protein product [Debaryomyces fabryi]
MSQVNHAAILSGSFDKGQLTEIGEIAYPKINDEQILIKAVAYAANPTDWKHAVFKLGGKGDIAGSDVSGTVAEIGSKVKGFEIGDVVSSFMRGNFSKTRGAFSDYVIADVNTTVKYDKSAFNSEALEVGDHNSSLINTFEGAASINLGLVTVGLSFHHKLGIKADKQANASKYILIWGGATATGILAIQVAKLAYGLNVITTASSKHHDFLKSLGADKVFDYHDSDVIEQIKKAGGSNIRYALDTVSNEQTFQSVYDATADSRDVSIDNLLSLSASNIKTDDSRHVSFHATLVYCVDGNDAKMGRSSVPSSPELVKDYNDFWFNIIPQYIPKIKHSNLKVLKSGLQSASEALELLREDKVNGQKVVFRGS